MRIELSNAMKITYSVSDQNEAKAIKELLELTSYPNPEYIKKKKYGLQIYNTPKVVSVAIKGMGYVMIPIGLYNKVMNILSKYFISPHILEAYSTVKYFERAWNPEVVLRPEQKSAVDAFVSEGNSMFGKVVHTNTGILVGKAGSGKTYTAMGIIHKIGVKTVWLVHTTELLDQAVKSAKKCMPDIHVQTIKGGASIKKFNPNTDLVVCSVQTLVRNPEFVDLLNDTHSMLIVDEGHHIPSSTFSKIVNKLKFKYKFALTATPIRKDGHTPLLHMQVGEIHHEIDVEELYATKALLLPKVEFIFTEYAEPSGAAEYVSVNGNYDNAFADYKTMKDNLLADTARMDLIVDNILMHTDKYQIILSESVEYAYQLYFKTLERLRKDKYPPEVKIVHGLISKYRYQSVNRAKAELMIKSGEGESMKFDSRSRRYKVKIRKYTDEEYAIRHISKSAREQIMELAKAKQVQILFATKIAQEGLDLPHLEVGHLVTPKMGGTEDAEKNFSGATVEQEIGRICRTDSDNPNKSPLWKDYVDYNVSVFRKQYQSRRKVYKELGIDLPRKTKSDSSLDDFLKSVFS